MLNVIQSIDESILLFIQNNVRNSILTPIMVFFTTIGNVGAVWLFLALIFIIVKKYRRIGIALFLAISISWIINDPIIKNIVARPRPFSTIEGLNVLISLPSSFSFPSGHSCASFAAAYTLTRTLGKNGAWFYIPAVLIALSRPYVGVHYLSDILVGAFVGTVIAMLVYRFVSKKYILKMTK